MNFGATVRHLNIDQIQKYFRIVLFDTFSYSGEPVEWIRDFRGNCYSLGERGWGEEREREEFPCSNAISSKFWRFGKNYFVKNIK